MKKILKQRLIKVDGNIRTDVTYPAGFMGENSLYQLHNPNSETVTFLHVHIRQADFTNNHRQDRFLSNDQVLPVVKLTGITSQKDFLKIIVQRIDHCS